MCFRYCSDYMCLSSEISCSTHNLEKLNSYCTELWSVGILHIISLMHQQSGFCRHPENNSSKTMSELLLCPHAWYELDSTVYSAADLKWVTLPTLIKRLRKVVGVKSWQQDDQSNLRSRNPTRRQAIKQGLSVLSQQEQCLHVKKKKKN